MHDFIERITAYVHWAIFLLLEVLSGFMLFQYNHYQGSIWFTQANTVSGIAMATCTFALWVGCCTLTFSFPSMNAALGSSGTFWIYSAICVSAFIFLFRQCPETKGKSLEQLEQELTAK